MLFSKDIQPVCGLCVHATPIDEETVLCHKKGPMPITDCCRKYKYDPCKRIPPCVKAPDFSKYKDEDFKLD